MQKHGQAHDLQGSSAVLHIIHMEEVWRDVRPELPHDEILELCKVQPFEGRFQD